MSVELAVTPTGVPLAAPSTTVLAAPFASVGVVGATSLTLMVNVCVVAKIPSVARTVML